MAAPLCWLDPNFPEQGAASQLEGSACSAEQALPDSRLMPAEGSVHSSSSPAWCLNVAVAPQSLLRP